MSTNTVWLEERSPGDLAARAKYEPGAPRYPDGAVVVYGPFYAMDWFTVPAETPHPAAGQRVRVTRRFYGPDPHMVGQGPQAEEDYVAHLWAEGAGIGVAESPQGFAVYELTGWPAAECRTCEWRVAPA